MCPVRPMRSRTISAVAYSLFPLPIPNPVRTTLMVSPFTLAYETKTASRERVHADVAEISRTFMDRKFGPPLQAGLFLIGTYSTGLSRPWTAGTADGRQPTADGEFWSRTQTDLCEMLDAFPKRHHLFSHFGNF